MQVIPGPDGRPRCFWCAQTEDFIPYHDHEWGFPVADSRRLFEKLCLESFQSGLSWRTILAKRENFRRAFNMFDYHQMAGFGPGKVEELLADPGIVRHRGKIEAVINNAARAVEMEAAEGSLAAFFWSFEPPENSIPYNAATSDASNRLAKELKRRGWKFVGPTTVHAFMQAMGMLNDHHPDCVTHAAAARARAAFARPGRG